MLLLTNSSQNITDYWYYYPLRDRDDGTSTQTLEATILFSAAAAHSLTASHDETCQIPSPKYTELWNAQVYFIDVWHGLIQSCEAQLKPGP